MLNPGLRHDCADSCRKFLKSDQWDMLSTSVQRIPAELQHPEWDLQDLIGCGSSADLCRCIVASATGLFQSRACAR
jgi:hypothetical protein